ncbi:MAG: hypothetical protein M1829_002503 [Trizodia sp. TS-e1964]|nr:MAG: hypothetical protein M1829_002503 [Trizodia sp. TS-e1964]
MRPLILVLLGFWSVTQVATIAVAAPKQASTPTLEQITMVENWLLAQTDATVCYRCNEYAKTVLHRADNSAECSQFMSLNLGKSYKCIAAYNTPHRRKREVVAGGEMEQITTATTSTSSLSELPYIAKRQVDMEFLGNTLMWSACIVSVLAVIIMPYDR